MPTPHKHAEFIKAWAEGQEIEQKRPSDSLWEPLGNWPGWNESWGYRIKPAAPKWPQTTMTDMLSKWDISLPVDQCMSKFAGAVIEHECSTGALVPADKVREIEAKARAEGIKEGSKQRFYTAGVLPSLLDIHGASLHFKVPK